MPDRGEKIVERWMLTITSDGGVEGFDDLHIDEIDPKWKHKDQWIEGGIEAFRIAMSLRDRHQLPFVVGLGFSLESGDRPRGVDFQTKEDFRARLDWSPPSLYLFQQGDEPRSQTADSLVQNLSPAVLGAQGDERCYYLEFRQQNGSELCRSVFLEG